MDSISFYNIHKSLSQCLSTQKHFLQFQNPYSLEQMYSLESNSQLLFKLFVSKFGSPFYLEIDIP